MEAIPDQIYTGKEIRPEVKLTSNGHPLKEEQDYDIVYQNNIEVGKASITVTGKGAYAGEQTIEFNIVYKKLTAVKNLKAVPAGARKVKLTWDKVRVRWLSGIWAEEWEIWLCRNDTHRNHIYR